MAISYQMPIWPHWLWNTGLRCAPRTVILRGFAVCVGLTRFPHPETGERPRFASLNRALPDKNTFIGADGKASATLQAPPFAQVYPPSIMSCDRVCANAHRDVCHL